MKKLIKRLFLLSLIAVLSVCFFSYYWVTRPVVPPTASAKIVTIDPGSSVRKIGQDLEEAGVTSYPSLFLLMARLSGKAAQIQAGSYEVTPGMTIYQLFEKMVTGQVLKSSLTIIEGWTFKQMRAAIDAHPDIKHDTKGLTDRQILEKITQTYSHPEGLFLPETYLFARGSSDLSIYKQAYGLMQSAMNKAWAERNPALPYKNVYEALKMASIIEKETGHAMDRDKVASVFVNRLRIGMRLQTDPTIIYGMGDAYQGNIRKRDLTTDTEYNTYLRNGLPPTPIALPSAASINAAFHPADSNDLYFVSKGDGTSHFSPNLREHNQAVNRYIRAK